MLKTLRNAFKIKDIRKKILYTFMMLVVIRIGSNLRIPGVDPKVVQEFFQQNDGALGFIRAITGGSFEQMSILALGITPYITSSIIMQLMTIAIPKLEEMQREGEDGRKKILEYTRYLTVGLALLQAIAMAVGFGTQGLLIKYGFKSVVVVVCTMTAGSAFLMWIGERITESGVGNGISMVLLFNIISSLPSDLSILYTKFIAGKSSIALQVLVGAIILALVFAMVVFVIILQDATRKIPVQYSAKTQGRRLVGAQNQNSSIPLKVNTAGVIPVIFASSLMSFPVVISQFLKVDPASFGGKILATLSSSNWFVVDKPWARDRKSVV